MMDQLKVDLEPEEMRIKSAYARRQGTYRYSWFNHAHVFRSQELERDILSLLKATHLDHLHDKRILDIGCGEGQWLRQFVKWGACPENVTGVDILEHRVIRARQLCPQGVQVHYGNAARLPFDNMSFDLVVQFVVFSSILDMTIKEMVAHEMLRVLKENGLILWYDFFRNNPSNPDVRGIQKNEISHLFRGCRIEFRRVSLAPPLCRMLAPYSWLGCYALERLRMFNTFYLAIIQKK
ncbi:MAG: class I SAM-dependent methyltransferase [Nitrospira sp.]|nr:class I SAM-dependent methyltransferase [Nitrospira sp.]